MTVEVQCSQCGKSYRVKDELAGKRVKCKCGEALKVPAKTTADDPLGLGTASSPSPLDDLLDSELPAGEASTLPAGTLPPSTSTAAQAPAKKVTRRVKKQKKEGMSSTLTSLLVAGFIVSVFAAVAIGLFLATALKKTGFESPETAFAAHQEALHEKQWDKLILTYTPANQKEMAFAVSYLAAEKYPRSEEVKQALQDNGLMTNLNPKSLPERETAHRNFSVPDDARCFAEMVEAYDTAAADRITNPVLRAIFRKSKGERIRERSSGTLRDLQMTGDTATATIFLVIEDDEEIEDSITFRQIDGRWFIHLDDDELHSHYFLGMNPLF